MFGRWTLHQALDDNRRWRAAGLMPVRVAANVSPLQLRHHNFIDEIRQAIGDNPHAAAGLRRDAGLSVQQTAVQRDARGKQSGSDVP